MEEFIFERLKNFNENIEVLDCPRKIIGNQNRVAIILDFMKKIDCDHLVAEFIGYITGDYKIIVYKTDETVLNFQVWEPGFDEVFSFGYITIQEGQDEEFCNNFHNPFSIMAARIIKYKNL